MLFVKRCIKKWTHHPDRWFVTSQRVFPSDCIFYGKNIALLLAGVQTSTWHVQVINNPSSWKQVFASHMFWGLWQFSEKTFSANSSPVVPEVIGNWGEMSTGVSRGGDGGVDSLDCLTCPPPLKLLHSLIHWVLVGGSSRSRCLACTSGEGAIEFLSTWNMYLGERVWWWESRPVKNMRPFDVNQSIPSKYQHFQMHQQPAGRPSRGVVPQIHN